MPWVFLTNENLKGAFEALLGYAIHHVDQKVDEVGDCIGESCPSRVLQKEIQWLIASYNLARRFPSSRRGRGSGW